MAQTIKLKRSATQNAVPSTSQLELGEVAINTYDGKMYIKKNDGSDSIVEIGGDATSSSGLDFTGNLNLEDNVRIVIGDGNDLQIYHDGSNSIIQESGTGDLKIQAQNLRLQDNDGTNFLYGVYNGRVELFHNNSKKFETTSSGISVTGDISLSGNIVDSDESEIISIAQNDIIFNGKHIQSAYGVWVRGENTNSNNRKAGIDSDSQALSLKFYTDSTEHIRIDSSGRLLVNTTSSVDNFAKIQVVGDSSSVARITLKDVDGTNQYTYFEQSGGGTRINTQNGTSNGFFTIGGWNGTTSVDLLRVTGDGRVGIGTNAPAKELHIASSQPDILLQDTDGTNQTSEITSSGGNLFLGSRNDTANGLIIFRGLGGGTGDEYARFNSNGKLGIGITSPEHPLHVSFSGDDGAQIKSTDNHSSLYINAGSGYGSYIRFEENNASKYWINAATDGSLRFRPAGGSSNWVVFDSTGQVGIGTTSPSRQLHVLKSGTTSAIMIEAGDGNQSSIDLKNTEGWFRLINDGGSLSVYDQSDSAERFRINTSGNVGIGTNSPGRRLTVQGDAGDNLPLRVVAGSGTSHGSMEFQDPNTTADYKVAIGSKGDAFYVQAGGSERVRIHSGGQLGIGVTNFTSALRGNGKQLIIGSCFVGTGAALVADDFARFGGAIYIHEDAGTNSANVTSLDNNGDRLVITGKGGTTANALDAPDGFYVGGTQFITSSRQITNVTSITATGAISTTGTASLGAINVGSSTSGNVFFKRPNANYIFADQSGGYLVFGTNGRSTSIANSNFYLGTNQDVHFQGSITVASNVTSSGSFTSSQNQQGFRHIAPDVMSGHTSRNEMTFSWTADETRWYMFPTVDGSSNFGRELSFDYSSEEWSIEGPVTLSSLSTTASTTSSFAGPLTVGGTTLANAFEFQVNGDAKITNYLEASQATFGNTTLTGFLRGPSTFTIDPATHGDDTGTVVIAGNLQVDGTTTTINSTTLTVDDLNITLASGAVNAAAANGAGITVDTAGAQLTYDATQDRWNMNKGLELIGTPLVVGTGTTDVGRVENSAGVFSLTAYTARQIAFGNDTNGEHVRIDANGNVGIGTTNPSEKLDIESAGSVNLEMNNTGNSVSLKLGAQSTAARLTAGPGDRLGLGAGNTVDYMTIASDGKVGIGTTSPGSKLSIHSALDDYSTTNPSATNSTLELRDTRAVAAGNGASIVLTGIYTSGGAHLGNAPYIKAYKVNSTDGNYSFGLKFATRQNGTSSQAVAMTIDDEQRVGIGTTSPARQIHVKDSNYNVARLERDGAGGGVALEFKNGDGNIWQVSNDGDEVLRFYYATNNRFQVTSTGAATFNNAFTLPTSDGSANQVLKTDGSGNVTWVTVQGVGTATEIADADGDTKIQVEEGTDEDIIRFDTAGTERMVILANGNVGISDAAPSKTLSVTGTFKSTGEAFFSHFDNTTSSSRMRDNLRLNFGNARTFAITGNSTNMHMKNGTADVITLDASSNVGIGTSSPATRLHVSGAYGTPQMRIGYDGTAGNGIFFHAQGGSTHTNWLVGQQRSLQGFEITPSTAAGGTTFSTPAFVINTGGDVGVGTIAPYYRIDARFNSAATSLSGGTSGNWGSDGIRVENTNTTIGSMSLTHFRVGDADWHVGAKRVGTDQADFIFAHEGNTKVSIDRTGNVGIGETSIDANLHITHTNPNLKFEIAGQGKWAIGMPAGQTYLAFDEADDALSTPTMVMTKTTKRVGIGTTAPGYLLHVDAAVSTDPSYIVASSATNFVVAMGSQNSPGVGQESFVGTLSNDDLKIKSNNTERIRVKADGRIGIGTPSPAYKLEVNGDSTTGVIAVKNAANGRDTFRSENAAGTRTFNVGNDASGHGNVIVRNSSGSITSYLAGSGSSYFNAGNVGIGTTTPSSLLHLKDTGDAVLIVEADSDNSTETDNARIELRQDGNNVAGYLYTEGNAGQTATGTIANTTVLESKGGGNDVGIHFATGGRAPAQSGGETDGTVRMTIHGSGGVTIGTTSTTNNGGLLVDNDIKTNSRLGIGSPGNTSTPALYNNSDTDTGVYWPAGNTLGLVTASTERLRITSAGLVGIGNGATTPTEKLHVFDNIDNSSALTTTGTDTRGGIIKVENDNSTVGSFAAFDLRTGTGDARIAAVKAASGDNSADLAFIVDDQSAGVGVERLRIEGETGYIGIGTNSPNVELDLRGNMRLDGSAGTDRQIYFRNQGTGGGSVRSDKNLSLWAGNGSGSLVQYVTIEEGGRVGIGRTNPAKYLHLQYSSSATAVHTGDGLSGGGDGGGALIQNTNTSGNTFANLDFRARDADGRIAYQYAGATNNGDFHFITDNLGSPHSQLIIRNNGKVEFNQHHTSLNGTANGATLAEFKNYVGTDLSQQKSFLDFIFSDTNGNETPQVRIGAEVGQNGDADTQIKEGSGAFVVYTNNADTTSGDAGASLAERFRVDYAGNVGIGTSTPGSRLEVKGTTTDNSADALNVRDSSNNQLFRVRNDGVVLIGDNYLYVTSTQGAYFDASVRFRNGITDDTGQLSLNSSTGDISFSNCDLESVGNITTNGYLRGPSTFTIDPATHGDDTGTVVIAGNLQVDGTTTTINSTTLTVDDKNITLASGSTNKAAANGAGITVDCGSDTDARIAYTSATDEWDINKSIHVSGAGGSGVKINSGNAIVGGGASGGDTQLMYWGGTVVYYGRNALGGTVSGHEFRIGGVTKLNVNSSGNTIASGKLGIGAASPQAKLQIEEAGIDTTTTSTTATTQVAIDTFAAATFRSARYTIQVTNSTDSTYHLTEILLIHDGTTPQITEYGTIFTGSAEATFDADISSGNVRLLATPATTDSMTFKVVRHCITV